MAAVVLDSGKTRFLQYLTSGGAAGVSLAGVRAHLYVNNVTPAHADMLGTYTEATWGGYASQLVPGWTSPILDGTFHASSSSTAGLSFNNTSGSTQTVYGYYITDSGTTVALVSERFAGAPLSILNGQNLILTPNATGTSEF